MRWFLASSGLCFLMACSSTPHHAAKKPPVPNLGDKPVQVTTRSGSLRQPGPEPPAAFDQPPTPTFAPDEAPARPARRFSSEIPQGNRAPLRQSPLGQAGSENPQDKPTMVDWLKGLGPDEKTPEPSASAPNPFESDAWKSTDPTAPPPSELGTSIDPRRVYRGPKPEEDTNESRRGASFSETGVPDTGTQFQGREDSAF